MFRSPASLPQNEINTFGSLRLFMRNVCDSRLTLFPACREEMFENPSSTINTIVDAGDCTGTPTQQDGRGDGSTQPVASSLSRGGSLFELPNIHPIVNEAENRYDVSSVYSLSKEQPLVVMSIL